MSDASTIEHVPTAQACEPVSLTHGAGGSTSCVSAGDAARQGPSTHAVTPTTPATAALLNLILSPFFYDVVSPIALDVDALVKVD